MKYSKDVDTEATLREVMDEVTLIDLGRYFKIIGINFGCLGFFFGIVSVVNVGADAVNIGWDVPNFVWVFFGSLLVLLTYTTDRSFRQWNMYFWFPKLSWGTAFVVPTVVAAIYQLFVVASDLPAGLPRNGAVAVVYLFCLFPVLMFWDLSNLGHMRLMKKRIAAEKHKRRSVSSSFD